MLWGKYKKSHNAGKLLHIYKRSVVGIKNIGGLDEDNRRR